MFDFVVDSLVRTFGSEDVLLLGNKKRIKSEENLKSWPFYMSLSKEFKSDFKGSSLMGPTQCQEQVIIEL